MPHKVGIIYRALCLDTNKMYIGLSRRKLEDVILRHTEKLFEKNKENKFNNDTKFARALRKHSSKTDWRWEILKDNIPIEDLNWYEIWFINTLDSKRNGYNSTSGGDGVRGIIWTEKQKIEYAKRMSGKGNPMFGRSVYDIWVKKHGKEVADEKREKWRNKTSKALVGKKNPLCGIPWPRNHNSKRFYVKTPNNEIIIFDGLRQIQIFFDNLNSNIKKHSSNRITLFNNKSYSLIKSEKTNK